MPHAQPRHANRLAGETSPYLLQHAHNPVDWFAWGEEAFTEARRRDVPIFLSIGYSTCYWCHVMERESFEDEATAALMNDRFVCVKVDREERPDVDDLYMTATQIMTGRGGWPMSSFLEPESLRPFWCGTYFPREPRQGLPAFTQVLEGIARAWKTQREDVLAQGEQVAGAVREALGGEAEPTPVGRAHVSGAIEGLLRTVDRTNGGFGGAPKFPQPANLMLLLDAREGAEGDTLAAIDASVRTTLDRMALGGMFDQVGGGFHRYSTDAIWLVPHFEKMLYDQAQLVIAYARAATVYADEFYGRIVRRTLDYVLREMTPSSEPGAGGFFSAQDAEVDGREGLNYLWTPEEVRGALPADDAELAIKLYGLDKGANFRDPHHRDEAARTILSLRDRPERLAGALGMTPNDLCAKLDSINEKLYSVRAQRKQPHLDDKVIVSWNAMMIEALVAGTSLTGDARYHEGAERAGTHILTRMRAPDGTLLRVARGGKAKTPAFLEDHAALIRALVALHASPFAAGDQRLRDAVEIADLAEAAFAAPGGGYFDTREGQGDLFVRTRSTYDGAIPCGSSLMLGALLMLHDATGEGRFLDRAVGALSSLSPRLARSPVAVVEATRQLLRMLRSPVLAGRMTLDEPQRFVTNDAAPFPVEVLASADTIEVAPDRPASFRLRLEIKDAYHIVAADPGEGGRGLIPLRVGLVRGQGVAVYADYPAGEAFDPGIPGVGDIRVHHGVIEFDVAIEHAPGVGPSTGDPILGVTFQACTQTECLEPRTLELGVEIDVSD
ncbi:MAG: thioredoxin domain-containing protein [Phycisphaerales bacterium]